MIEMIQMICDGSDAGLQDHLRAVFKRVLWCFLSLLFSLAKLGKKVKGAGWLYRVERCLLRPTTLLNFLFKSGSNLNLWPINLEMVCGSGCPDFGSLGLSTRFNPRNRVAL